MARTTNVFVRVEPERKEQAESAKESLSKTRGRCFCKTRGRCFWQDKGTLLLSAKQDKSSVPLSYRELRKIQMFIKEHYKEMYVMRKQYSENDFFENE